MGFLVNILFRIGEIIILAIIQVIIGVVLSRLNRHLGQSPAEVKHGFGALFRTLRGRPKYQIDPARGHGMITCGSCGARVPRRKFCANCGLRLKKGATPLARQ